VRIRSKQPLTRPPVRGFYFMTKGVGFIPMLEEPYQTLDLSEVDDIHRAALAVLAEDMQADPKKQGKEKKPGCIW
jgi:hypothetical protein